MPGRVERGYPNEGGTAPFTTDQRIWLLERDLDESDRVTALFRDEMRQELKGIRKMVTNRLNWIVGIGFTLLVAVISVLVTVIASSRP